MSDESMVERISAVIAYRTNLIGHGDLADTIARDVLRAMRAPTEAMVQARIAYSAGRETGVTKWTASGGWRAMLDAALAEPSR